MEQYTAVNDIPSRSLPDAWLRRKPRGDEEQNVLVAGAVHDLRNPLTAITGMTQVLRWGLERDGGLRQSDLAHGLERIDAMAAQMDAIIRQLLEATRPTPRHTQVLHRTSVDLTALALEVVTEQEMLGVSHQICIDAPQPVIGRWDRSLSRRLVSNLLSNAIKYSPEGSVVLVAVHREEAAGEAWATLTITDHGRGIPARDLPSVFDAFYRSQGVTANVPGTGLGLAIVHRIVDQHGGQVAITSEEGKGTSVVVRLPIGDE